MEVDHNTEVTVCCGATEAMASVFLALVDPGDEIIVFEPFYENYGPDAILAGAAPVFVPLEAPNWTLDPERLRAAFTKRTKAIVLNTPHNPTGRVFTRAELSLIAELCQRPFEPGHLLPQAVVVAQGGFEGFGGLFEEGRDFAAIVAAHRRRKLGLPHIERHDGEVGRRNSTVAGCVIHVHVGSQRWRFPPAPSWRLLR
jgi:hypothetical protein